MCRARPLLQSALLPQGVAFSSCAHAPPPPPQAASPRLLGRQSGASSRVLRSGHVAPPAAPLAIAPPSTSETSRWCNTAVSGVCNSVGF